MGTWTNDGSGGSAPDELAHCQKLTRWTGNMEVHLLQKCHNDGTFKGSLVEFVFVCYNVLSKSALGNPVCACTCDGQGTNLVSEHSGVTTTTFGDLLKRLRKRAGMTQDDLAAAIGYSRSLVGALERNDRLPDIEVVIQTYLPAVGLAGRTAPGSPACSGGGHGTW